MIRVVCLKSKTVYFRYLNRFDIVLTRVPMFYGVKLTAVHTSYSTRVRLCICALVNELRLQLGRRLTFSSNFRLVRHFIHNRFNLHANEARLWLSIGNILKDNDFTLFHHQLIDAVSPFWFFRTLSLAKGNVISK